MDSPFVEALAASLPEREAAYLRANSSILDCSPDGGGIAGEFDVVVASGCLERSEQPLALMAAQMAACKSLYIARVPYNEFPLGPEHRAQFRVESFPLAVDRFSRIHVELIAGERLLVVYGSDSYGQERVARDSTALAVARLVAAQLVDRQKAAMAEAALDVCLRAALTAETERDLQRQRADNAEASLRSEQAKLKERLLVERQTFALFRDKTKAGLEDYQAQFERRLSVYRSERAWRLMVAMRKAHAALVQRGSTSPEPVFPHLPDFIPPEILKPAAPLDNLPELGGDLLSRIEPDELVAAFFALLLRDAPDSKEVWSSFRRTLHEACDDFSSALGRNLDGDDLIHFLTLLLIPVARHGVLSPERTVRMFHAAEDLGVHTLPVHFYSPIPETSAIEDSAWSEQFHRAGVWDLNAPRQLALLEELGRIATELETIPETGSESEFHWDNPAYSQTDAAVYYSMIRHFRPALVIEVGAGYSTLIAAAACTRNRDTVLEAADPFPPPFVSGPVPGLTGLVSDAVQQIPLASFQALNENDILFIDSTHVSKIASDVNYLMFSVLPSLNKGVLIHFHDIFLPWSYPRSWIMEHNIFWNEQYLLLAFLMFNEQFEIVLANHYLGRAYPDRLLRAFPFLTEPAASAEWSRRTPSSLWLRRK